MKACTSTTGIPIVYDEVGRGDPALLFLPGWCTARTVFRKLMARCGGARRVLSPDWRGHGESGPPGGDFGHEGLVADALAVIAASGAERVVPAASSHAGWVAIELARRLGSGAAAIVLLDWIVTEPPPAFRDVLRGLQSPERWRETVDVLSSVWTHGTDDADVLRFTRDSVAAFGFDMWSRAAREIEAEYTAAKSPLDALARLSPPVPVLHVYAQPDDAEYFEKQAAFERKHSWFHVRKLAAASHFPMLEAPGPVSAAIADFLAAHIGQPVTARGGD